MEKIFYTVTKINGDYCIMMSDEGVENTVAMAFLPIEVLEGTRLICENFEYRIHQ